MKPSWWISTRERRMYPEWMDRPDIDVKIHQAALRGLSRINSLSLSHRILWPSIRDFSRSQPASIVRVLDVACGGGDVILRLDRLARRAGLMIQFDGCDFSSTAVAMATRQAEQCGSGCRFIQFDALRSSWPTDYDVVCSSLFLHHLPPEAARHWLATAAAAAKSVVLVSDLVRSHWGYLLARVFSQLLTRSLVVHYDAPVSVEGAFTPCELRALATEAGLTGATVQRRWPARMLLQWNKQ